MSVNYLYHEKMSQVSIAVNASETRTLMHLPVTGTTITLKINTTYGSDNYTIATVTFTAGTAETKTVPNYSTIQVQYDGEQDMTVTNHSSRAISFYNAEYYLSHEEPEKHYGFKEDKSKVEVVAKGDFIILTGIIENVPAKQTKGAYFSVETLAEYGIYTVDDFIVVSMAISERTYNPNGGTWTWGGYAEHSYESSGYYYDSVYPRVSATIPNKDAYVSGLSIYVYNINNAVAQSYAYKVVLLKLT